MVLLSPISWPLGKLLDRLLGAGKSGTLGRRQLSALVDVHRSDTGLGGNLTLDEVGCWQSRPLAWW
jgi:metal transporter CNNM